MKEKRPVERSETKVKDGKVDGKCLLKRLEFMEWTEHG
jgi:hypothetical protein